MTPAKKKKADGGLASYVSLRDYFAAHAITGLLSYASGDDFESGAFKLKSAQIYAAAAYQLADALLAERSKG